VDARWISDAVSGASRSRSLVVTPILLISLVALIHGAALLVSAVMRGNRYAFGFEALADSLLVKVSAMPQPTVMGGYEQRLDEGVSIPFPYGGWLVDWIRKPPALRTPESLPRVSRNEDLPHVTNLKVASLARNPWKSLSIRHSSLYVSEELIEVMAGWIMLTAERIARTDVAPAKSPTLGSPLVDATGL
jgi:hypothetical protein